MNKHFFNIFQSDCRACDEYIIFPKQFTNSFYINVQSRHKIFQKTYDWKNLDDIASSSSTERQLVLDKIN